MLNFLSIRYLHNHMKFRHFLLTTATLAAFPFLASCGDKADDASADGAKVMRISAIPDQNTTAQAERFEPLRAYLAEKLDIEVEFVVADSYPSSVEKFANGDIHFAWFGGVTGVQAIQRVEGARAIVAGQKDLAFKSYFVANSSTGLQPSDEFPTQIADMNFTFGSQSSTSGRVMPSFYINEETGTYPDEFFNKPVSFTKGHDSVAIAVQNGDYQAGVLSFSKYEAMVESGDLDPAKCVKIWETPEYFDYNLTVHPELEALFGEGFIDKLQTVLVDCDDAAVLKALGREKLVAIDNSNLDQVEAAMEAIGL